MTARIVLRDLERLGQSIWLDFIERDILENGTLRRLIQWDGISGVTSNPSIFAQSFAASERYRSTIADLQQRGASPEQIYERLVVDDVRRAADILGPVFQQTGGRDGFVSLEVAADLAYQTGSTVAEARRLWSIVDRPNLMIKVPATRAGLAAIRELISGGINVNATLLFSVGRYANVLAAYIAGLEDRARRGASLSDIASVASFFLSRIDSWVDCRLDQLRAANDASTTARVAAVRGQAALASAGMAYEHFQAAHDSPRWRALEKSGARRQRLLWASTSTKDPRYADTRYVDALIGPDTVNTLPLATLRAYQDHGQPQARLWDAVARSREIIEALEDLGIGLGDAAAQLERDGIEQFATAYHKTLAGLATPLSPLRVAH